MGVTGGACAWFRLVFEHVSFSTIGQPSASVPSGIHEQDNRRMPALAQPVLGQRDQVVPDSPIGMGGSSPSLVPPVSGAWRPRRGMRPAGWNSRSPKKLSGDYVATDNGVVSDGKTSKDGKMDSFPDGLVVKRNARVVPLSGDEGMSHPEGMSSGVPLKGMGQKVTRTMYLLRM